MSYISPKFKQTGTDLEQIGNLPLKLNDILKIKEGWIKYDAINAKFYYSSDEGATWLPIGDLQSLSQIDDVNITSLQDGQVLVYDSATSKWINTTLDALPDQAGNAGKYLTTDGTNASWAEVDALPDQTGNDGKFLKTDGTEASWVAVNLDDTAVEIAKGTRLVSASIATITDGGLTVTIPAYKAHIVDHATNTLTMAEKTTPTVLTPPNYTQPIWFAYVTAANTIQWESTEIGVPANRTLVPIFSALTNGTAIVALNNGARGSYRDFNGFIQDYALATPPRSVIGNVITLTDPQAIGGCLVNKTVGQIFTPGANIIGNSAGSEGIIASPAFAPYTAITNDFRNGSGGFSNSVASRLDGDIWDDGSGTPQTVPNTRYTIRPIYVGQGALIVSPLGQNTYTSATNAKNALGTDVLEFNPNLGGLLLLGWAICRGNNLEFQFIANANASVGGAPNVSLNLWSTRTLTNADSPFTVVGSKTIYICDTTAGNIEVVLPTVDTSIASDENRFIKSADANRVKVYVNGAVQTIAGKTEQYIWENGGAFSVIAADTLTYLITQDNRKEDTFQTPTYVWGKTGSIDTYDASGSTLGTGATVTGDNHSVTLTTGTTVSSIGFKSVATQEKIKEKNFFKFQYSASHSNEFQIVAQGLNGSAWVDVSASVLLIEAGENVDGLIGFNKSTYTAFRVVVSNLTTNAGRTFTLSRGEWTDRFSELVEVKNDSISSKVYSSTSFGSTNTQVVRFISGDINVENDLYKIETSAALGTVLTVKKRCLIGSAITISAANANNIGIIKNAAPSTSPTAQDKDNRLAAATVASANYEGSCSHAEIELQEGDKLFPMAETALSDATGNICVWTITATPLSSSKGYVYESALDDEIGEIRITAEPQAPSGFIAVDNKSLGKTGANHSGDSFKKLYKKIWEYPSLTVSTTASKGYRLHAASKGATWLADWDAGVLLFIDLDGEHLRISNTLAGSHVDDAFQAFKTGQMSWCSNGSYVPGVHPSAPGPSVSGIRTSSGDVVTTSKQVLTDGVFYPSGTNGTPRTADETRVKATYHYAYIRYAASARTIVGPVAVQVDTEWQSYTPTFTNLGTVTAIDVKWRRIGSQIEISGSWTNGTVSAGSATISLPSITPTLSSGTKIVGNYGSQGSVGNGPAVLNGAAKSIYFGIGNWQVAATGTQLASAGFMSMFATIPVPDWKPMDSALIASPAKDAHKNATYLSSTETEAGWHVARNKQIYKRTITYNTDNVPTPNNLGTAITPIGHRFYAQRWLLSSIAAGAPYSYAYYDKATGDISKDSSSYGILSGTELEIFYTKD